ncbi:CoA transferase [Novosphingobium sp.]|uniref:CaiB/BaiF CoA transferase family protein n=1 Tax=Novosphingobium sp. TaxID=1874826 RepID=UPI00286CED05|nr:CoA transferase [Novosphingobium sp.]
MQPGMLDGIKVIDLTSVVFGPYSTQILADLGADVIKVEVPGSGDAFRWSGASPGGPGMAPGFLALNRGKRSVVLDLKNPEDRQVMLGLLADADMFAVNVRGKALERLGLDYAAVSALNPKIVYLHCVGFGQDGPYDDLQAYDDVIQAASGTATLLPRVDGNPSPRYLPSLIADKVAGLHGAYAALAALFHRQRTGEGQYVEVPMFECFTSFMLLEHLDAQTFEPPLGPAGYGRQIDPYRQPFATSDGHISIVIYTLDAWDRIFGILDDAAFLADPRFADARGRVAQQDALYQRLAELTPQMTTAQLLDACHAAQLPAQPVRDLDEVIDDPHLNATGFFRRREHPHVGPYVEQAQPVRFGRGTPDERRVPPKLDEHGAEVRGLTLR